MKECRKCRVLKPLQAFYKHKQMKDGHLNICKECKKEYALKKYNSNIADDDWMNKERERGREKTKRRNRQFPEQIKAHNASRCIEARDGMRKHHWSYQDEHLTDVIVLSKEDHTKLHCYIKYFQPAKMFHTIFGCPLYTKDMFCDYMNYILGHTHEEIINKFLI